MQDPCSSDAHASSTSTHGSVLVNPYSQFDRYTCLHLPAHMHVMGIHLTPPATTPVPALLGLCSGSGSGPSDSPQLHVSKTQFGFVEGVEEGIALN
jgi:hypothetical protein